jgi:FkbM family methyltransferase
MKLLQLLIKIPIFKRLVPSIVRRVLIFLKVYSIRYNFNHIKLILDIRDPIDRVILFHNHYEKEQLDFLLEKIKENNITHFIDIGANIGIYTLFIKSRIDSIKVISFEPHHGAFTRLIENIKINNFQLAITSINKGLSNIKGFMFIEGPKNLGINQSGGAKLLDKGTNKVEVTTVDKEIHLEGYNIAIKIDVEGYENKVISGCKELFRNNNILLQIEIFDSNYKEVNAMLLALNFIQEKKIELNHAFDTNDYYYLNY